MKSWNSDIDKKYKECFNTQKLTKDQKKQLRIFANYFAGYWYSLGFYKAQDEADYAFNKASEKLIDFK